MSTTEIAPIVLPAVSPAQLSTLSEDELLVRARAGDRLAYGVLYDRNCRIAFSVARQASTGLELEDVVAEAFLKVLNAIERGAGPVYGFRAYLMTAVRTVAATRGARHVDWVAEVPDAADPDTSALERVESRFDDAAVWDALDRLPRRWQHVLWLAAVEDRSPAEIGERLGMSANNASAILYRARKRMRELWAEPSDES